MPDVFVSKKKKSSKGEEDQKAKDERKKIVHEMHLDGVKKGSTNPLLAFSFMPGKIDFENREPKEEVVLLLRRHPITNIGWIILTILMFFAPYVIEPLKAHTSLPQEFQIVLLLCWYLITFSFAFQKFLNWFFNVNIITDERIVDFDFHNLVYKKVSDTNIDKIQDVTYIVGGAIRTFFNYGDVLIQTASEVPNFDFLAVPKPNKVAEILQDLRIEEEIEKLEGRIR